MGVPQAMGALRERAAFVRESLQKSQTITDNMVSILGSFDYRLSALETAMRPTQVCLFISFVWIVCLLMWIVIQPRKETEIDFKKKKILILVNFRYGRIRLEKLMRILIRR